MANADEQHGEIDHVEVKCLACQLYYRMRGWCEKANTSCPYCGYKLDKYLVYVVRWRYHRKLPNNPMANPIFKGYRNPWEPVEVNTPWIGLADTELDERDE